MFIDTAPKSRARHVVLHLYRFIAGPQARPRGCKYFIYPQITQIPADNTGRRVGPKMLYEKRRIRSLNRKTCQALFRPVSRS